MKLLKQATYAGYVLAKLAQIKIFPNQDTELLRFLFTKDYLKTEKGLELVSRPHFSYNFLIKVFFLMFNKQAKLHHQTVFTTQVI